MSDAYSFVKRCRVGNASAKLVLIAIAEYADEHGSSQPSSKRLREDTELSARTISSSLDLLEAKGIIVRVRQKDGRGKRAPDVIELVGFTEWRDRLKELTPNTILPSAKSAPKDQVQNLHVQMPQMQEPHVQIQHVQPPAPPSPPSFLSPTPPIITTPSSTPPPVPGFELRSKPCEPAKSTKSKLAAPKRRAAYAPAFNEVWLSWPASRRERSDKQTAFRRWQAGVEQFGEEAIARAAERYLSLPDTRKDGYRYCCLVEVFMNGKLEAAVEAVSTALDAEGNAVEFTPEQWAKGLALWRDGRRWIKDLGPKPDEKGYRGPPVEQAT